MRSGRLVTAVLTSAALVLAGCATDEGDGDEGTPTSLRLYGTDGIMQNAFGAELSEPGVLHGAKGTVPMNQLPTEFQDRLRDVDPDLEGFLFAGESYDAVVISALAAEFAGTTDPEVVRDYIPVVTVGGTECEQVAECLELARAGEQFAYRAVSLAGGLTARGEPAVGTYATQHFGREGQLDQDKTEYIGSGAPDGTEVEPLDPGPRPTEPAFQREPLVLGGLLPETGELAIAYPPLIAGAQLAVREVNDAGGVLDLDVEWIDGDDGTDPDVARATLASHVDEGVHIIIGAAASGVSEAVLPDVVQARRILFSPSNTAAGLGDDAQGWYFRTAPPDELQGEALADMILRDGNEKVALVARDDVYGRGLRDNVLEALVRLGVPQSDIRLLTYGVPQEEDGPIPGLNELVGQIVSTQPDGLLVIGFGEASQLIEGLVDEGMLD